MRIALLTTDNRENDRQYWREQPQFGTAPEALLFGFRELPEVEVHVISCLQESVASPDRLAANIDYHALFVPKFGWLRTGYQGCIRAVRRKLREVCPDVVHAQGTERDCALSAVFSGFPSVVTLHGNMRTLAKLHRAKPWSYLGLTAFLEEVALRRSDGVVCITSYTERNVYSANHRTWIIPNAVDPSFFSVQSTPSDPPTILCVGLICPRKNQLALIDALAPLRKELVFHVLFLGAAPSGKPYTNTFFERIGQEPWTKHSGFADRDRLKAELSGASLVALPSLEDNCPMVLLEAAAAGVPVVASRVGGIPDLIENEMNGFLCDPLDPTSIRDAVRRALALPSHARTLAAEAKRRALEQFHPRAVARRHLAVYAEILEGRNTHESGARG